MVGRADGPGGAPAAAVAGRAAGALPWWLSTGFAVVAGGALLVAFPPYGWWWVAPLGVALLAAAVHRRRARAGAGLGMVTGLVLFVPMLSWTDVDIGVLPWALLSTLQAGYLALLGLAGAVTSRVADRWRWSWPVLTGVLWVAQEALRSRTPFGGFPWGRLAFSQGDAPTVRFAAVGGAPLVTFVVALAGGLLVTAVWWLWQPGVAAGLAAGAAPAARPGRRVVSAGLVVAAVGVSVVGWAVPVGAGSGRLVTVAIVQGNVPRMGLDFNDQRRAVLDNHVRETISLAERVAAGRERQPVLVVWPENSSDIDPLRNPDAADRISAAAAAIRAPILVGAVLIGPGAGRVRNVGLLWRPGTGPDLEQLYVKRHPVPFAEYVPLRDIARRVSKEVDRVRSDFVAGDRVGVVRTGEVVIGDVICFEVAYDGLVRDAVAGGAQALVVQTNNATFNEAEARQQLQMVQVRAVEHGRASLMASTVGVSGFVTPDGRVDGATGFFTAAVVVRDMRLYEGRTVATRLGVWPEAVMVAFAVAGLAAAVVARRRREGPVGARDAAEVGDRRVGERSRV
ncbi:apolipoprotein N-acyltransferase [Plantactinospora sp. GCM10030261]|uniref:apolipoprotein N-acyltransferase n=1 Tax=Plantactinospora sp. GCM10030261 TaxID=3273420 RepID=UPI0036239A9B